MQTGEAHVIVRAIDGDVLSAIFLKSTHEREEVGFATHFTHVFGGEVGVHAGAVPVGGTQRLAVILHVDSVLLAKTVQDVTGHPDLVSTGLGAFAENLEFPLTLRHFGVDAFMIDAGIQTDIEVLFDDLTGDVADVIVSDAGVVRALRGWVTIFRETERAAILIKEILLLKTEPGIRIIQDGGTVIGSVRRTVGIIDLTHDENAILAGAVRIECHWLQHTVRAAAGCLPC